MKRSASNPPFRFTPASIAAIKPLAKRVTYRDTDVPALGLQVNPGGYRSFFWYSKTNGRPRWRQIGTPENVTVAQARDKARALTGKLTAWKLNDYQGPDPFAEPECAMTIGALIESYVSRRIREQAKRPEAAEKRMRWVADRYLRDWKSKRLADVARRDVMKLHETIGQSSGHIMANRTIETLRTLFNFARDKEMFDGDNPAARIEKFYEKKRKRYLQPTELAKLAHALRDEPNQDLADFVRLSLHLGARKSDVLAMRWADLSLTDNGPLWNVPETTKSEEPYVIPLTPEAGAILTRRLRAREGDCQFVFPSPRGGHRVDLKKAWAKLLERAGLADADVTQHDLRRTFASYQAGLGASLHIVGKSLGHSDTASTQVYARLGIQPVRDSIMAATRVIAAAMSTPSSPRRQLKGPRHE
jgi:integrase